MSFPSFPLLLLCFYLHFAWSSTTSFFSRIFCGHKKIIQSCVYAMCVHKAAFPIGWNTERKTHTSAAQFEHWYGSLMIPTVDQYHCAHLLRQIESVFSVLCLMRITCVEIWTHTHTHHVFTILPYFHIRIQCHPPPLLTFYYFHYQNMSIPLNKLIVSHTYPHRHTQRKPITTLLYIHILPWLCLWLNSLSPRTADAIVSPLGCYEREWDLRFPFWLKRLAVALHLWAPTHSGMKLQG